MSNQIIYKSNPSLPTLFKKGWTGNPINKYGQFYNPIYPFIPVFTDHLQWLTQSNHQRVEKKNDKWKMQSISDFRYLGDEKSDVLVWLGHASFFARIAGISILIDPVFGSLPGVKRQSELPEFLEYLHSIDIIMISHNHRDHCDKKSIQLIAKKFPHAQYLTGLGTDKLIQKWTKSDNIQGAGWYQKYQSSGANLDIYFMPARHWTRRILFDTNKDLWGSFIIKSDVHTLYYSGDTGYGSHFAETSQYFPNIDTAIIGIGTYQPSFESPMHINPEDAYKGFEDLKAKHLIPMHYGTFDLSHEPMSEPINRLVKCASTEKIKVLKIGENYFLTPHSNYKSHLIKIKNSLLNLNEN